MNKIVDELILYLINKKQNLNEEIENILYSDMNKNLNIDDYIEIEKKRKLIKECYSMVDYLENAVKKFMED